MYLQPKCIFNISAHQSLDTFKNSILPCMCVKKLISDLRHPVVEKDTQRKKNYFNTVPKREYQVTKPLVGETF